jgi:uncharacterized protein CbrC (UPF0167 family)
MDEIPAFAYHSDPVATESLEESDASCDACGRARGLVYAGAVYAVQSELRICPWCIADGTAAAKFGATFSDTAPWVPEGLPQAVVEEIEQRTPGFESWQGAHWLFHCNDGAAFISRVGGKELSTHPDALEMIRQECADSGWDAEQTEAYLDAMHADGEVTGYLFRCIQCGAHLAYSDFS